LAAAVATWEAWRPVLGAPTCSRRLCEASVNLGIGDARGLVGGRWHRLAFCLREVRVVMAVLVEHYKLLVVAAAGLW
jgi:hypothetical protein